VTTYTHTTFAQAKTQLAALLGDSAKVFWTDDELGSYIKEALRTWGLATGYWKATATVPLVAGQAFYDVRVDCVDSGGTPLQGSTITDRDVINDICYALMEPPIVTWSGGWIGSEQFSLDQIVTALQRNRDEILALTGMIASEQSYNIAAGVQRLPLDETAIRVLRVAVQDTFSTNQPLPIWSIDEHQAQTTTPSSYAPELSRPKAYSTTYVPNLSLDLWPAPGTTYIVSAYQITRGVTFTPTINASPIGLPDDLVWLLKYMTIADICSSDGISNAPAIAQYANQRVQDGLILIDRYQSLLWSNIDQRRSSVTSLASLDLHRPTWASVQGSPRTFHLMNWNVFGCNQVPSTNQDAAVEMVRKAIVPTSDTDYIQVSSDLMPMLLSFCQHLSHVKIQGAEFQMMMPQYQALIDRANTFKSGVAASGVFYPTLQWRVKQNRWTVPFKKDSEIQSVTQTLGED